MEFNLWNFIWDYFCRNWVGVHAVLPGDSLLFTCPAGRLLTIGSLVWFAVRIIGAAAILEIWTNYWMKSHFFGEKLIANPKVPINQET